MHVQAFVINQGVDCCFGICVCANKATGSLCRCVMTEREQEHETGDLRDGPSQPRGAGRLKLKQRNRFWMMSSPKIVFG